MTKLCSKDNPSAKRGVFVAEVTANRIICRDHYLLRLAGEFPPTKAGQFVQLQCRRIDERLGVAVVDWPADRPPVLAQPELTLKTPLLRRPLSLAGRRDCGDGVAELDIIYRAVGAGTQWLAGVKPATQLSVLGPLGNRFAIAADKPAAILVGGGVGTPPMLYLARALLAAGKKVVAFYGAKSAEMLPLSEIEKVAGAEAVFATDDGSLGFGGLVGDALTDWLETSGADPAELAAYSCGPEPMMKAVGDICIARDIPCQLALERHMACGMGTCQSCVVKIRDDSKRGWSYKLCCKDGPGFEARDIIWQ